MLLQIRLHPLSWDHRKKCNKSLARQYAERHHLSQTEEGSPTMKNGIQPTDVITALDGDWLVERCTVI